MTLSVAFGRSEARCSPTETGLIGALSPQRRSVDRGDRRDLVRVVGPVVPAG
jgi:hypothetical protein